MANYFEDRDVEYPGRVTISPVGASIATAELYGDNLVIGGATDVITADLERAEGTITNEGTPLNAYNLNTGINELVGRRVQSFHVTAGSQETMSIDSTSEAYVVLWRSNGSSGGIDFVLFDDEGAVTARNLYLLGTQLVTYGATSGGFTLSNTASSTTVHALVIGA